MILFPIHVLKKWMHLLPTERKTPSGNYLNRIHHPDLARRNRCPAGNSRILGWRKLRRGGGGFRQKSGRWKRSEEEYLSNNTFIYVPNGKCGDVQHGVLITTFLSVQMRWTFPQPLIQSCHQGYPWRRFQDRGNYPGSGDIRNNAAIWTVFRDPGSAFSGWWIARRYHERTVSELNLDRWSVFISSGIGFSTRRTIHASIRQMVFYRLRWGWWLSRTDRSPHPVDCRHLPGSALRIMEWYLAEQEILSGCMTCVR